jgi:hypothetical protein
LFCPFGLSAFGARNWPFFVRLPYYSIHASQFKLSALIIKLFLFLDGNLPIDKKAFIIYYYIVSRTNKGGFMVKMGNVDVCGTFLQGYINAKYSDMIKVFGNPNSEGDEHKTDAEWFGTIDGDVFTIYNYKDGKNYNGKDGLSVKNITDWHIGGFKKIVVEKLTKYFESKIEKNPFTPAQIERAQGRIWLK